MKYRLNCFHFRRKKWKYFVYKFWELTSLYGLSFIRWGISCVVSVLLYSMIFIVFGKLQLISAGTFHWYDAFHFSIATFTTLGIGDVQAVDMFTKIISDIEVFNGYLMLGVFMALVQKRIF